MLRSAHFARVHRLRQDGLSIREISRATGYARNSVRKLLRSESAPAPRRRIRRSYLDGFKEALGESWRRDRLTAAALFREIKLKGFQGSAQIVRRFVHDLKKKAARRPRGSEVFNLAYKPYRDGGRAAPSFARFLDEVEGFGGHNLQTKIHCIDGPDGHLVLRYTNSFWTAGARSLHSLHEVPYRGCFKAELPRFLITRLTGAGDVVYDPFMGRGTTLVEASLLGRRVAGCDVNPVSKMLVEPRLGPPALASIKARLASIDLQGCSDVRRDLEVFFHPRTLAEISALRTYLQQSFERGSADKVDAWIRMVAMTRLTGHSGGFFSGYTLPPNVAPTVRGQARINARLARPAPYRDVRAILLAKSKQLLRSGGVASPWTSAAPKLITRSCGSVPEIADESVQLVVTSPPFLCVIDYEKESWLKAWFGGVDLGTVPFWHIPNPKFWCDAMTTACVDVNRVLRPGGAAAFDVGVVDRGETNLEEPMIAAGEKAGLRCEIVMVNQQSFSKTAHIWGVKNNALGTNTNRIVVFRKR